MEQGKAVEAAAAQGITQAEIEQTIGSCPEPPKPDEKELEAAFWFHRSFLAAALQGAHCLPRHPIPYLK